MNCVCDEHEVAESLSWNVGQMLANGDKLSRSEGKLKRKATISVLLMSSYEVILALR